MLRKSRSGFCSQIQEVKCQHRALQPYLGAQGEAEARSAPAEAVLAVLVVHSEWAAGAPALGSSSEVAQGKERGLWHQRYPGKIRLHSSELLQQTSTCTDEPHPSPRGKQVNGGGVGEKEE